MTTSVTRPAPRKQPNAHQIAEALERAFKRMFNTTTRFFQAVADDEPDERTREDDSIQPNDGVTPRRSC